ncbi:MAG: hypothetical protein GF347_04810 [Candidatus Moranbacteria bacterium]|nr:hypothetical protein [Candidatus Moranbacteria bacterium]
MKKAARLLLMGMLTLTLTACTKNKEESSDKNNDATKESMTEKETTKKEQTEQDGAIKDLSAAFQKGTKMECSYKMDVDGQKVESIMQLDGKKFKTQSEYQGVKSFSVSDGKTLYTWQSDKNKGTKIDYSCVDKMTENLPKEDKKQIEQMNGMQDPEAMFEEMGMEVNCKKISSVDVNVPKDVQFVDQCQMMDKLEMFKDMQ